MPHPKEDSTSVQLEALLRLKKHEQPEADFWSDFDARLKERTLQTLVKRQHWSHRVLSSLKASLHPSFAMPAAAAAAVALLISATSPVFQANQVIQENTAITAQIDRPSMGQATDAGTAGTQSPSEIKQVAEAQFASNTIESPSEDSELYIRMHGSPSINNELNERYYVASTFADHNTLGASSQLSYQ